ncbi:fatty acid CoA ligase family protein [Actinomycetospora rhizophila]|uniref:Fatty acid CoA ligase family protein n=1 Tax=Actinomycetospora rhizophila TaxID=1416876 RepID=A0ABV9ZFA0_9PSEU
MTGTRLATLDTMLADRAREQPDRAALVLPAPGRGPLEPVLGERTTRTVTFGELDARVDRVAAGLHAAGVGPGARVALLVPPVADFFVLAYALMRARAVPVVVDPGIGLRRVRRCLAEAAPDAFAGVAKAHLARRALGWAPEARLAIAAGGVPVPGATSVRDLERRGAVGRLDAERPADTPAAIVFTSGSTGPPKGVEHHDDGLVAQAALVRDLYGLGPGDVSLATFPPFALFGPALGMTTVVPRMDPTRPGRVRAARLVRAARRTGATTMFGSPAVLDRLGRDAPGGTILPALRTVISAGAPVPRDVQRRVLALLGAGARVHTPYGATEALPVATIGSDELLDLPDDGICVGRPVPGVEVTLMRVADGPVATLTPELAVPDGEVGEVVVRGPVVSPRYADRPEATAATRVDWDGAPAHRMGDLASRDAEGRLWFAGRVSHVVPTADGPLYSVPCEEVLNRDPAVRRSALVGLGTGAVRRPVLVVEPARGSAPTDVLRDHLLGVAHADHRTRAVQDVVFHPALPVDPRHNSKIDREALERWVAGQRGPA